MDLLVDIGNSRVKWALAAGGELMATAGQQSHRGVLPADLFGEMWGNLDRPDRIKIGCVGNASLRNSVSNWCYTRWGLRPEFIVATDQGWGVTNSYRVPESLGVDRWLALISAKYKWNNKTVFIADCGTAVTIDVLGCDGVHRGGLIIPGLSLMRETLFQGTAGIVPGVGTPSANPALFAADTQSAVMGGTLYALVSTLDRTFRDVEAEMDQVVIPVITGGDASELQPLLGAKFIHAPNLVLEGLAIVAGRRP